MYFLFCKERYWLFSDSNPVSSLYYRVLVPIVAAMFNAVHFAGWNYHFPMCYDVDCLTGGRSAFVHDA